MGRSGYTCIRHTLCIINLLFWVIGCGMLGIGIWLHIVYGGYANLLPSYQIISAGSLSIAAGIITFLVAFFGCCGSWFQNKCLLITYFSLVVIIFLLEFTAGTLGFIYRKHVAEILKEELVMGLKEKYKMDNGNGVTEAWDHIQTEGCYEKMHFWLMQQLYIVAIICMLFAFIQLFGLISAMLLVCRINEKRKMR